MSKILHSHTTAAFPQPLSKEGALPTKVQTLFLLTCSYADGDFKKLNQHFNLLSTQTDV